MRTLVIGDIHGCLEALQALWEAVRPLPDDVVITLGDYVDRGLDSAGVLDFLINWHQQGKLFPLLGNHEEMMLRARAHLQDKDLWKAWMNSGGQATLDSYPEPKPGQNPLSVVPASHWRFLDTQCQDFLETPHAIFVHANLVPDLPPANQPLEVLRWGGGFPIVYIPHDSGKTMVCGHTAQPNGLPLILPGVVCLDTGAYDGGWLTCLDWDTGQFWQANQLGRVRVHHVDDVPRPKH